MKQAVGTPSWKITLEIRPERCTTYLLTFVYGKENLFFFIPRHHTETIAHFKVQFSQRIAFKLYQALKSFCYEKESITTLLSQSG